MLAHKQPKWYLFVQLAVTSIRWFSLRNKSITNSIITGIYHLHKLHLSAVVKYLLRVSSLLAFRSIYYLIFFVPIRRRTLRFVHKPCFEVLGTAGEEQQHIMSIRWITTNKQTSKQTKNSKTRWSSIITGINNIDKIRDSSNNNNDNNGISSLLIHTKCRHIIST